MNLRTLAVSVALSTAWLAVPAAAQDVPRIAVVDLQRALNTVEEGVAARDRLEADLTRRQQEFETAQADLERQATEFEAAMTMMTQEAAMQRYQEIQQAALELQTQYEQHQMELSAAEGEATAEIAERMVAVVAEMATESGYTVVLDASAVVYNSEAIDVTAELIRRYDARY